MIFATYYWRIEFGRLARILRRHMSQQRWWPASDASVEKCVMFGFYAVRKMQDAFQPIPLPDDLPLVTFPRNGNRLSRISWPNVREAFDLARPKPETLALRKVCDQVVHSHFFSLWLGGDRALRGIFFCSEKNKDQKIYRLNIEDVVELFEQIARTRIKTASLAHFYPDHNRLVM